MKKISIIVPCYNADKWITETLDSLLAQTYKDIEIIVVDDGSTDKSLEIVCDYIQKDNRIRLIQQVNAGVSAARNNGVENATGEYIAFCDADDYLNNEAYEQMIDTLEQNDADIVFCEFERFWPNGKKQKTIETSFVDLCNNPQAIFPFWSSTPSNTVDNCLYTKDIHGSCWRSVFKRQLILENNLRFNVNLKFAEDQIFVLKYLSQCKKIGYISNHFVHYRGHTKPWVYRNMYDNHMELLKEQLEILQVNRYYSDKQKKQIAGYLKCTTYFSIILPELMFKPDADKAIKAYTKNKDFRELLTTYNFIQKYKYKKEFNRIILFILLKLRCFKLVKKFWKNKKY